jgi:hypothetical protein
MDGLGDDRGPHDDLGRAAGQPAAARRVNAHRGECELETMQLQRVDARRPQRPAVTIALRGEQEPRDELVVGLRRQSACAAAGALKLDSTSAVSAPSRRLAPIVIASARSCSPMTAAVNARRGSRRSRP